MAGAPPPAQVFDRDVDDLFALDDEQVRAELSSNAFSKSANSVGFTLAIMQNSRIVMCCHSACRTKAACTACPQCRARAAPLVPGMKQTNVLHIIICIARRCMSSLTRPHHTLEVQDQGWDHEEDIANEDEQVELAPEAAASAAEAEAAQLAAEAAELERELRKARPCSSLRCMCDGITTPDTGGEAGVRQRGIGVLRRQHTC